ncbi:MAG: phage portal protein [Chloroflexi bacterium]|nr:phage portal protein [Chloroflexota bacterium]
MTMPGLMAQMLMDEALREERERLLRFQNAWKSYYGQHPKPLRVKPGQPDDNVIANYARVIVDTGVSFLFGQELRFELDETEQTEAEQWLAGAWQANRKMTTLTKLALNGAVTGHAFLKMVVDPVRQYPRLIVLDPSIVFPRWDRNDIERVRAYRIQFNYQDEQTGKPRNFRQLIEEDGPRWRITDQVSEPDSLRWQTVAETVWPWPWPPVVDCQNLPAPNSYWGISDLEDDVLGLNRSINFVLSNLSRILKVHAHPKTWGKGFQADQLNIAVDETIVFPSPDAALHNLEMLSDLSSSIEFYQRLKEALHEISRTPEVATGKVEGVGALSGVALAILFRPLIEKTNTKRLLYGDLLVELNRRLLALGGFGEDNRTALHWPELLPKSEKEEAETLLLHQQLGVSQDTVLQKAGYDPDLEKQKREASSQEMGDRLLQGFERGQGGQEQ